MSNCRFKSLTSLDVLSLVVLVELYTNGIELTVPVTLPILIVVGLFEESST